jgi:hypothetical protein
VFQADRAPPATTAPNRFAAYLAAGVLAASALLLLARAARTRRSARAAIALATFFWGIVTGFFGVILALLWLFTSHTAAYPNLNLLQVNPLGLLLAAAAPFAVIASHSSRISRLAWPTAVALAALSIVGVLLHAFPPLRQVNGPLIALLLPIHLAVLASLYHVRGSVPSHRVDMPAAAAARAAA